MFLVHSVFERKWTPVRVKKTRQNKNLQQPRQMLLMRLSSAASSGSIFSFSGDGVSALCILLRRGGNGASPLTWPSGESDGGTDGLAGADKALRE